MRGLEYFLDIANNPALTALYAPWIGFQVRSITDNAQATSGDGGNVWSVKMTRFSDQRSSEWLSVPGTLPLK